MGFTATFRRDLFDDATNLNIAELIERIECPSV